MKGYFCKYKYSLLLVAVVVYLSFFTPPKTGLDEITDFDKFVHVCMYGGLCSVIWVEYLRSHRANSCLRVFVGAVLLPLLFSAAIELLQEYATENRSGDWEDMVANSVGVILAALAGSFVYPRLFRR